MATIDTVNAYYKAILRTTPPASLAQALATQIDSGALTLTAFEGQLLSQSFNTTIPALVVYDAFFGTTPTSAGLDFLTNYATQLGAQGFSLQNVYVNLGASFATTGTTFQAQYGSMDNTTFLTTAYTNVFGHGPSADAQTYLLNQFAFYQSYFNGSSIASKGAMYGVLLFISDGQQNGKYAAPAAEFLNAAATSTAPYGQELNAVYGSGLTPIYNLTDNLPNHTTSEGSDVTVSLHTTNVVSGLTFTTVAPGTVLTYTLSGTAVTQNMISGPLSGQLTVGNDGSAAVTIHTLANILTSSPGGTATVVFNLSNGASSDTITLTEGYQTIANNKPGGVNEGSDVTFTVSTAGVNPATVAGTLENWTLSGVGAAQVSGAHSGQITLDANGQAVITLHTLANVFNSGVNPNLTITLGNGTTNTVVVNEVATQTISDNTGGHPINQGNSVTFTVSTGGVLGSAVAGTVETWAITGTAASQVVGPTSGQVTLDANGQASVTISTAANVFGSSPSTGSLVFTLANSASDTVTVNEGTAVVQNTASINEGSSVTFTLATTNMPAGTVEAWSLSGAGLSQVSGPTSGIVTVGANGTATVTVNTLANVFNQPPGTQEPLNITFSGAATTTGQVKINETSTFTVNAAAPVSEGSSLSFTIVTNNVPAGTQVTYTVSGLGAGQVTSPLTGTATIGANGTATVQLNTVANVFDAAPGTSVPVTLSLDGISGASNSGSINEDATITVAPSPNPQTVHEDSGANSAVFVISASANVPAGTTVAYTLSGTALGNVALAQQTGVATVSPGGTITVAIPILANDLSGATKTLTLTLNGLTTPSASASIIEDAHGIFVLTTGTDNFTGNPLGNNTFIATEATLGQNDLLLGGGANNTLSLSTQGAGPVFLSSFQTGNADGTDAIQTFQINANAGLGNVFGTTVDMSGAFGVVTVLDQNSSGNLTLNNVQNPVLLTIQNPSQIGFFTTNVTLNYIASALTTIGSQPNNSFGLQLPSGQSVTLINSLGPVTGLPNTALWVTNEPALTITSTAGNNGLSAINAGTSLTDLTFTGAGNMVLGDGPASFGFFVPVTFTGVFNYLDATTLGGTVYDLGDGPVTFATKAGAAYTQISLGAGGINSAFQAPGSAGYVIAGGGLSSGRNATINIAGGSLRLDVGAGNAIGQGILMTSGGSVTIDTINGGGGGYISGSNAATIDTRGGSATITGITGLGGSGSFITTNTTALNGGSLMIGSLANPLNGGIAYEAISTGTGQATIIGGTGDERLDFSQQTFSLNAGGGASQSAAPQTGFHGKITVADDTDVYVGGSGTNTLIFDPNVNNVTKTEGLATNVGNLVLQTQPLGDNWNPNAAPNAGGVTPANSVDLARLDQTGMVQNIYMGGQGLTLGMNNAVTFIKAVSGDNFFVDTSVTTTLAGTVFGFDYNGAANGSQVLNLELDNVGVSQSLTVRDFSTSGAANNPVGRFSYKTYGNPGGPVSTTLTIDTLNALRELDLAGSAAVALAVLDTATQAATISIVNGAGDNANIDLRGLMTVGSTGAAYANSGNGAADALIGGTVANPSTITLGSGSDHIAVGGGSWNITTTGAYTTIVVNPISGNLDTINATGGHDTITDGAVGGGGGLVNITVDSGHNLIQFDQSGALPQLQSADVIQAGLNTPDDTVQVIFGATIMFDAGFTNMRGIENFQVAAGVSNQIQLDFNANLDALTSATGALNIITGGGGLLTSSTLVNAGAGYDSPLIVTIGVITGVDNGGDLGGDTITTHLATIPHSNPLIVVSYVNDFNNTFIAAPLTVQGTAEGIFATTSAPNTLFLLADGGNAGIFGNGTQGINNVQTIVGLEQNPLSFSSMTVTLLNDNNINGVATINLLGVQGNSAVFGNVATASLTITGGTGAFDTLNGGSNSDHITAHGGTQNFLFGGGGADTLTGTAGAGGSVTDFIYSAVTQSSGLNVDTITNFHSATDVLAINPATLTGGPAVVTFLGNATDYATALSMLNPIVDPHGAVFITTGGSTGVLWIDTNNDGNLNAQDYQFNITFASPVLTSANFDTNLSDWNNIYSPAINGTPLHFSGYLCDGIPLVGGQAADYTLVLDDGANTQNGVLVGFTNLVISAGAHVDVSVAQWNFFNDAGNLTTGGGIQYVAFSGPGGSLTTNNMVENYNLCELTSGATVTLANHTHDFSIVGSDYNDTLNIGNLDVGFGTVNIDLGAGQNLLQTGGFGFSSPDIHNATITDTGGTTQLLLSVSNTSLELTSAQETLFDAGGVILVTGGSNSLEVTDNAQTVIAGANEQNINQFYLDANSTTVDVSVGNGSGGGVVGFDGSIKLAAFLFGGGQSDVVNLDNGTPSLNTVSDITHYATFTHFNSGSGGSHDTINLTLDGYAQNASFTTISNTTGNFSTTAPHSIFDVTSGSQHLSSGASTAASTVITALNTAANTTAHALAANSEFTFAIGTSSTNSGGSTLIYEAHTDGSGHVGAVQLVGVLDVNPNSLVHQNFGI